MGHDVSKEWTAQCKYEKKNPHNKAQVISYNTEN